MTNKIIKFGDYRIMAKDFDAIKYPDSHPDYPNYLDYVNYLTTLPYRDWWRIMCRDRPNRAPELLATDVDLIRVAVGVLVAKDCGDEESAYKIMAHLEQYVKDGQEHTLGHYEAEIRGYLYSETDGAQFALTSNYM